MQRLRGGSVLPLLVWLLASFATAAFAHKLIGLVGQVDVGGDAYDGYAHLTLAPVALGSLTLLTTLLLWSALRALSRSQAVDPVALLARRFGTMRPALPCAAVALGGFATLLGMEFTEQISALGHVEGVSDALGGNVCVGLCLIVLVAGVVTTVGLRAARALVSAAAAAVGLLLVCIVAKVSFAIDRAAIVRRVQRRRHASTPAFLARCFGLRAPPPPFV